MNTLLQRNGDPVGVLVTKGFRDTLELRRLRLPKANDFFVEKPVSLVPRRHVREISERLRSDGSVLVPVVRGEVDRFALLEDASGYSYILRVGDRVHNGSVVSIGEDELVARVTNFGQTTTVRLRLVGR